MTIIEASGRDKDEMDVWEESFEGYVKVELRGGERNIKMTTRRELAQGCTIFWNEPLVLEVLDNANELRVMLCKDKFTQLPDGTTKRGSQVLAACGIYVSDILDAVPIDKYFELFKPGTGGEGGFIRLGVDYSSDEPLPPNVSRPDGYTNGATRPIIIVTNPKKRFGWVLPFVMVIAAAAGGAFASTLWHESKQKREAKSSSSGGGAKGSIKKK